MSGLYILTSNLMYDLGEMNPLMSLEVMVWCLCGGLILGALGSYFTRRDASLLIRKLIEDENFTPDRAITLEEAGLASNLPLRLSLRTGKPLRRLLTCVNEADFPKKKCSFIRRFFTGEREIVQTDLKTARFYLPEEMKYRAETRYNVKNVTPLDLILSVAILIAAGFVAIYAAPKLVDLLGGFLSSFSS